MVDISLKTLTSNVQLHICKLLNYRGDSAKYLERLDTADQFLSLTDPGAYDLRRASFVKLNKRFPFEEVEEM